MRLRATCLLSALLSASPLGLWAHDAPARPEPKPDAPVPAQTASGLTLPQLIERLNQNNPQLRSSQNSTLGTQLGVEPARAPDNPVFNVTQNPVLHNPFALGTSTAMNWGVSQNLPWPGKRRLAGDIAQANADVSQQQTEQLRIGLIGQLRSSWIAWQQTHAQIGLTEQQLQRLEQMKNITKVRYANNAAAYGDYINAQVAQSQLSADLLGLQRQQQTLVTQIAALIGVPAQGDLPLAVERMAPQQHAQPVTDFETRALDINPQLKASAFALEGAQRNVELAELGKLPDFNVGLIANSNAPPWGFGNNLNYGFSLNVTVPLYYAEKEKYLIAQARAYLASAQDADESTRQQIQAAVRTAYLQWTQGLDQLRVIETRVIAQAQVGYRLMLTNYANGQASYTDLLNAFTALKSAEISLEQARANALQARIALDQAVGEP